MEQKSFYSSIKVQSPFKSITTIPAALPAIPLSGGIDRIDGVLFQFYLFPKGCCISFTIPLFHPFLFPKNYQKECSLSFVKREDLTLSRPGGGSDSTPPPLEFFLYNSKMPYDIEKTF